MKNSSTASGVVPFDFVPKCIQIETRYSWPLYADFSTLLEPINNFLRENPGLCVKTCETARFQVKGGHVKDKSDFIQKGESKKPFVKGVRLWVEKGRNSQPAAAEQIAYVTFVPKGTDKNATNTLENLTEQVNEYLRAHPLSGQLISVESLQISDVKDGYKEFDTTSQIPEFGAIPTGGMLYGFLNIFRVWYRIGGEPQLQTIGLIDVFPAPAGTTNSWGSKPALQGFGEVLDSCNNLIGKLPGNTNVLTVATLIARVDSQNQVRNEERYSDFHVGLYFRRRYMRFLRVAYVIPPVNPQTAPPAYVSRHISTRLFLPAVLEEPSLMRAGEFEMMIELKKRLQNWTKLTNARVISVETVQFKAISGGEYDDGFDTMCTFSRWQNGGMYEVPEEEQYILGFRVYLEGQRPSDPDGFVWPDTTETFRPSSGCQVV